MPYIFFTLCVEPLCVHGFACASMWMFLFCLSVPGRSHSVTFRRLTLPTSCVLCKQKLLPFPALQQVTHAFCHFCRQRITMNLQLQEGEKKQHLAQCRTRTPPHESLGTMKPQGLEGRKMRRYPPPHSSCYFQLLALRCHWH